MNKLALCTLVAGSIAATPALAGDKRRYKEDRYDDRRNSSQEYGDVTDVQPLYREVRIEEPRRECYDERVVYQERDERDGYWLDNGRAGGLVGAIAGGVAGHQFGKGRGKDAATVLGAIIGAGVGQRVAYQNSAPRQTIERVAYEERCRTVSNYRIEQRVEGYDVTYRYGGRTYNTTLPYDPGKRIPLNVDVQPVSY